MMHRSNYIVQQTLTTTNMLVCFWIWMPQKLTTKQQHNRITMSKCWVDTQYIIDQVTFQEATVDQRTGKHRVWNLLKYLSACLCACDCERHRNTTTNVQHLSGCRIHHWWLIKWHFRKQNERRCASVCKVKPLIKQHRRKQQFTDWIEYSLTSHPTQYRSFRRQSSQPITWLLLTKWFTKELGNNASEICQHT